MIPKVHPKKWKLFLQETSGQDILEYALLAGIVAVIAVAFLQKFSNTYANVPNLLLMKVSAAF